MKMRETGQDVLPAVAVPLPVDSPAFPDAVCRVRQVSFRKYSPGIMKFVALQLRADREKRIFPFDFRFHVSMALRALLHFEPHRQDTCHRKTPARHLQGFPQINEPAAFGIDRKAFFGRVPERAQEAFVAGKFPGVRLRKPSANVKGIQTGAAWLWSASILTISAPLSARAWRFSG